MAYDSKLFELLLKAPVNALAYEVGKNRSLLMWPYSFDWQGRDETSHNLCVCLSGSNTLFTMIYKDLCTLFTMINNACADEHIAQLISRI